MGHENVQCLQKELPKHKLYSKRSDNKDADLSNSKTCKSENGNTSFSSGDKRLDEDSEKYCVEPELKSKVRQRVQFREFDTKTSTANRSSAIDTKESSSLVGRPSYLYTSKHKPDSMGQSSVPIAQGMYLMRAGQTLTEEEARLATRQRILQSARQRQEGSSNIYKNSQ